MYYKQKKWPRLTLRKDNEPTMARFFVFSMLMFITFVFASGCGPAKEDLQLIDLSNRSFGVIPDNMPGSDNDNDALISLGKKLYFDNRLSANDSQSCNTCHDVTAKKGGVDNAATSKGAFGNLGDRNSPTVFNAGFHISQFWDGRAKDLAEQAKGPILNPVEMAMPDEQSVVNKLKAIPEYDKTFAEAFSGQENPLTYDNIALAIAAFERTLITRDRFDDFQKGNTKALTDAEKKGLHTFIATGCTQCHLGPLLGGNMFQKMGAINPYENDSDLGLFNVTNKEKDKFMFKVPSLRNITITQPYFHDGKTAELTQAIKLMAYLQLDRNITDDQASQIASFMGSLTDKARE